MKKILIIDDNADLRAMMRLVTEDGRATRRISGERVFVGLSRIELGATGSSSLDVSMPVMTGAELIVELARRGAPRSFKDHPRRPVVATQAAPNQRSLLKPVSATLLQGGSS